MFLAIAVDTHQHKNDYDIWFLEFDDFKQLKRIGQISREELIDELFQRKNWYALSKNDPEPKPIELVDFVSLNMFYNTHFGNLATVDEMQSTIDLLRNKIPKSQKVA